MKTLDPEDLRRKQRPREGREGEVDAPRRKRMNRNVGDRVSVEELLTMKLFLSLQQPGISALHERVSTRCNVFVHFPPATG